ncbi:sensor histidine kinase [Paenibacillus chungangensis]|uniref:Sensor histidine kinase n=1 Tax=Paenibacillus chungangensis TaxID=696535 RepID=A0ABW3HVS5_9BACL
MSLLHRLAGHTFFLKLVFAFCGIIVAAMTFTAIFVSNGMANRLINTEAKYEYELAEKFQTEMDEHLINIHDAFTQAYLPGDLGLSISDMLHKQEGTQRRNTSIQMQLQNICKSNLEITDMMIIAENNDVFFCSNVKYRDVVPTSQLIQSQTIQTMRQFSTNRVQLFRNYVPDYISGVEKEKLEPVASLYMSLYNLNEIQDKYKLGTMVMNIDLERMGEQILEKLQDMRGSLLMLDQEGYVYFDSKDEHTANTRTELLSEPMTNVDENIINRFPSEQTNMMYLNIVEKGDIIKNVRAIQLDVVKYIALFIGMTLLTSILVIRVFMKRIYRLIRHMRFLQSGSFNHEIKISSNDELGYLEISFNKMQEKLQHLVEVEYLSQIKMKTLELNALQAQINPHFIFNALESIKVLSLGEQHQNAAKMISLLGKMIRWNLHESEMMIPIESEIRYLQYYLQFQNIRYMHALQIELDIMKEASPFVIPKLSLQPIVENCIHHGAAYTSGKVTIKISIHVTNGMITIKIADNGIGMKPDKLAQIREKLAKNEQSHHLYHIGLSNVHQRNQLLFGEAYSIHIHSEWNEGTVVVITLPAMIKEEFDV